jgi:hypothetical protein
MRRLLIALLAVAGLVVMTAVPVGAADEVPFKTKATVVSTTPVQPIPEVCGDPDLGFLGQVVVYEGTGTHLGRFELVETICLDFSELEPPAQPMLPFEVLGTYYAANGDELDFHVDGVINVITGETTDDGFHFAGGFGRFESATGSGHAMLIRDAEGILLGQTTSGVISYAASNRSG